MFDFTGEGHLSIMGSCLDYINIREFDDYVAAREHLRSSSPQNPTMSDSSIDTASFRLPPRIWKPPQARKLPRRRYRYSATSFMSSASSYSARRSVNYSESEEDLDIFKKSKTTLGNLKRRRSTGSMVARTNRSVVQLERDVLTAEWLSNMRAKNDNTKDNLQQAATTPDSVINSSANPKGSHPGILFSAAHRTSTHVTSTDGDLANRPRRIEITEPNSPDPAVQATGSTPFQEAGSVPQFFSTAIINDNSEDVISDKISNSWQTKSQIQPEPLALELNDIAGNHVMPSDSCKNDGDDDAPDTRSIDDVERQILSPSFPASNTSIPGSFRGSEIHGDDSVADVQSTKSQTLEEYPALASYAINRAFVHARLSRADPDEIIKKLIQQNCWSRWYALQEGVTTHSTSKEFLKSQGLQNWVEIARVYSS
ncbi:hypothetical protein M434DRAFT_26384 [Hypoxylon sp. CO27-5]|nr:hypothetical protein M434DRAFT_26384 [Hypoxylon sp. CO27-5]